MTKNYAYVFENLLKGYEDIKEYFLPLGAIEELLPVKEKVLTFNLPRYLGIDPIARWSNLKLTKSILDEACEALDRYSVKIGDDGVTQPNGLLMNIKLAKFLTERYQQDVNFVINDLSLETLFYAIKTGNKELVIAMLQENPQLVECTDIDGIGPIHICSRTDQNEILKTLVIQFKADVNQRTEYGNTPMHIAAEYGKFGTLLELKRLGGDITLENRANESILDFLQQYNVRISPDFAQEIFDESNSLIAEGNFTLTITGDDSSIHIY